MRIKTRAFINLEKPNTADKLYAIIYFSETVTNRKFNSRPFHVSLEVKTRKGNREYDTYYKEESEAICKVEILTKYYQNKGYKII